jgi:peptidoglycan/xylan/chitin deacetylase (PgdA/CDA1 family)
MSSKIKNGVIYLILLIVVVLFFSVISVSGKKNNYLYLNKTKTINEVKINYPYFKNETINVNINNYLNEIDKTKYDMVDYNINYTDNYISVLFSKYKNKKIAGYDSYIFNQKGNIVSLDSLIKDHSSLIENIKNYADKNNIDITGYDINNPICYLLNNELGVILVGNDNNELKFSTLTINYDQLSAFNEDSSLSNKNQKEENNEESIQNDDLVMPTVYDKVIAFTFDDGPSKYTLEIMDILDEYDSKATFFEVGYMIRNNKDIVKEVVNRGFEVGNHTTDHSNLRKLSYDTIKTKINDNNSLFYEITGKKMIYLRPPYGNLNDNVKRIADVPIIKWSVDSRDWESRNKDMIVSLVKSTVKDGDIVLFHDLYQSTKEAIEVLVPDLICEGYKIVSVSELFNLKNIELEPQKVYNKAQ